MISAPVSCVRSMPDSSDASTDRRSDALPAHVRRQQVRDRLLNRVALVAVRAEERARDDLLLVLLVYRELQLTLADGADEDVHEVASHQLCPPAAFTALPLCPHCRSALGARTTAAC